MRLQCSASSWGSKLSGAHKMSVLGLDVGTSTCKGVVLSADGSILAQEQYAYADAVRLDGPKAELPPSCFEDSVKTIVAALAARCKDDPIRAIAVSSHGETLVRSVQTENRWRTPCSAWIAAVRKILMD